MALGKTQRSVLLNSNKAVCFGLTSMKYTGRFHCLYELAFLARRLGHNYTERKRTWNYPPDSKCYCPPHLFLTSFFSWPCLSSIHPCICPRKYPSINQSINSYSYPSMESLAICSPRRSVETSRRRSHWADGRERMR